MPKVDEEQSAAGKAEEKSEAKKAEEGGQTC